MIIIKSDPEIDIMRQAGVQFFDELRIRHVFDEANVHRFVTAFKAERERGRERQEHVRVKALRVPQRQLCFVERAGHATV